MDGIEHVSIKYDLLIHIFLFECQAAQRRAIFFSAVDFEPWLNGLIHRCDFEPLDQVVLRFEGDAPYVAKKSTSAFDGLN